MKSHGQPSRYVKCGWCRKHFRIHACDLRRRKGLFCSRRCLWEAWRDFRVRYALRQDDDLKKAA